jgi:hypothetical protein
METFYDAINNENPKTYVCEICLNWGNNNMNKVVKSTRTEKKEIIYGNYLLSYQNVDQRKLSLVFIFLPIIELTNETIAYRIDVD